MLLSHKQRRRIAGLGLALGLLGGTLAACGTSSSGTSAGSGSGGSSGQLRIYGEGLPLSWDPIFDSSGLDIRQLSLVYDGLTQLSPTGTAQPGVAKSWSYSANGLALTFTLKPGLTFSDGSPVDAAAVKQNLDRARTAVGSLVASLLTAISSETVVSPLVIRLNLKQPDQELPLTLGGKAGMLASSRVLSKDPASLATKPVGGGPFKLTSFVPNGEANLVRNPKFWDAKDIHIPSVYLSGLTDSESVLTALQSGQANYAVIDGPQVSAAKQAGFHIAVIQNHVSGIEVSNKKAPFNNPQIVQAINYAINRKSLAQSQTFGFGLPDDEPEPPKYFAYSPAAANYYTYDPAKARQLLAQAGHPNGAGLSFVITTTAPTSLAEALQSQLSAVGIKTTINTIPLTESNDLIFVKHEEAFAVSGFALREAPIDLLGLIFGADGLLNESRDATGQMTSALSSAANVPLTSPKFDKTIQNVVALGVKDNPIIYLYTTPAIIATAKNVTGLTNYIDYPEFQGVRVGG
jgi:peptide/nickel transport system substrate-binding protein